MLPAVCIPDCPSLDANAHCKVSLVDDDGYDVGTMLAPNRMGFCYLLSASARQSMLPAGTPISESYPKLGFVLRRLRPRAYGLRGATAP